MEFWMVNGQTKIRIESLCFMLAVKSKILYYIIENLLSLDHKIANFWDDMNEQNKTSMYSFYWISISVRDHKKGKTTHCVKRFEIKCLK